MNLHEKRVDPSHPLECKRKLDIPRHNSKPSILSYFVFKFRFGFCLMPWKIFPYLLKVATFSLCLEQMPLIFNPYVYSLSIYFPTDRSFHLSMIPSVPKCSNCHFRNLSRKNPSFQRHSSAFWVTQTTIATRRRTTRRVFDVPSRWDGNQHGGRSIH